MAVYMGYRALLLLACTFASSAGQDAMASEGCSVAAAQPEEANALMQRKKESRVIKANQQDGKQKALVSHSGTVGLLLNEMNSFIADKGESGLDPDEIEHIHSIKALVETTVLPTILEGVEQSRAELAGLYQDIMDCDTTHEAAINFSSSIVNTSRKTVTMDSRICRQMEDELHKKWKEACETVNRSRIAVFGPGSEELPPPDTADEDVIEYLKFMDQFFCGRVEVFHDEVETCKDLEINWTNTHEKCIWSQKELETQHCSTSTKLTVGCGDLSQCWTKAVKAYNNKRRTLMELEAARIEAYGGATSIVCLWSAWIYEGMPCTVNKTRVKECHEVPPNLSNVTIEFPAPPSPPDCAFSTSSDGPIEVCSEEWFEVNYADLGLSEELRQEIRDTCVPCPPTTWTLAPTVVTHLNMVNLKHIGAKNFMKVAVGDPDDDCDAYVSTNEPNAQSITVTPAPASQKFRVEIVATGAGTTQWIESDNYMLTFMDEITYMLKDGDIVGLSIVGGQASLQINGDSIYTRQDDAGMIAGQGKVSVCGAPGTSLGADFGTIPLV